MKIFITGGTGFIGSAVIRELLDAGHHVTGLARSESSAARLRDAGVDPVIGTLKDHDVLLRAAETSDGVIHLAFPMEFDDFAGSVETERLAVVALGEALAGTDKPLIVPSGTALMRAGSILEESDSGDPETSGPRRATEQEVHRMSQDGVRGVIVRLGTSVHGPEDHRGFIPGFIAIARDRGASAYVEDGLNRWPAVHHLDAAHLFRLAVESAPAGSTLHAIGDNAIPFHDIATAIGKGLDLPTVSIDSEQVSDHFAAFGALAPVAAADIPASSQATKELLGWEPTHPGLLEDLHAGFYFHP